MKEKYIRKCSMPVVISAALCTILFGFFSCRTRPVPQMPEIPLAEKAVISPLIDDNGVKTADELAGFFMMNRPDADRSKVMRLAALYISECRDEKINSDIAFVQMCLETGFLRFGGLVTEDMNNFCGLGAIDKDRRGVVMPTEELGVRAHVQHLHAYGTVRPLVKELADPRYKYVNPRGKAPTYRGLAGTWAADPLYGDKLSVLIEKLQNYTAERGTVLK